MKKTKVGQSRKLLLRGEVLAKLGIADLHQVVGGEEGSIIPTACSHPPTAAVK